MTPKTILSWILRLGIAAMFVIAALPKLTAQAEPTAMFEQLGGAPMMYLTGVMELAAAVLLLVPKTKAYGAVLALGVMGGAIVSHLAVLGLGGMFPLAVVLFVAAGVLLALHRGDLVALCRCCGVCSAKTGTDEAAT